MREEFALISAGVEPDLNLPVAYVGRQVDERLTVYKLIQRANGYWYNYGQWLSTGRFRLTDDARSDRTRPLRLSDSRLDRMLRSVADDSA